MDLSIIIPHNGPSLGLWATISTCERQLSESQHDYEYVIVSNGEELPYEMKLLLGFLKNKKLVHVHIPEALTPPAARTRGVEASHGKLLFFFDNHCIPGNRYFDRAVADFERYDMAQVHSATRFFVGDIHHYHYRLALKEKFWGTPGVLIPSYSLPYRIAAAGHGGFAIKREVWDAVEGYGPDNLYDGYGGEEFNLDLKLWRMGFDNWMDPKLEHDHWAGNRPYTRHYSDKYYVNFLTSAYVIGGEKWLLSVYDSFANRSHIRLRPQQPMFDLLQEAYKRGKEYSQVLDSKAVLSLDEVVEKFRREQIAYE